MQNIAMLVYIMFLFYFYVFEKSRSRSCCHEQFIVHWSLSKTSTKHKNLNLSSLFLNWFTRNCTWYTMKVAFARVHTAVCWQALIYNNPKHIESNKKLRDLQLYSKLLTKLQHVHWMIWYKAIQGLSVWSKWESRELLTTQ